eukprot:scaffold659517_cov59-Attheya_sp.AAC.2
MESEADGEGNNKHERDVKMDPYHVVVIVLGDVGRSPRMQYHALSLLEHGCRVTLVGYQGEALVPPLSHQNKERFRVIRFSPLQVPVAIRRYALPVHLLLRLIFLIYGLARALRSTLSPEPTQNKTSDAPVPIMDAVLVQNPPSIPLLAMVYFFCHIYVPWWGRIRFRGGSNTRPNHKRPKFIVDWHNLGHAMLDLSPRHVLVRVALAYEQYFSRTADAHFCVTNAMKDYLESESFQLLPNTICVLHDRPPSFFVPELSCQVRHDLWQRLDSELRPFCPANWWTIPPSPNHDTAIHDSGSTVVSTTLFTKECHSVVEDRVDSNRPALVVSSTSWTPDEDFGILLDALVELKSKLVDSKNEGFPNLLVVVTGKGPQKQYYQEKMATLRQELEAANIAICTLWLEPEDYPRLVACADLGISLHTSTSGLDLPMKVLDLFGCHVPVCAVQFKCLDELVQHDVNGTTFLTAHQLSHQLYTLLQPLSHRTNPTETTTLKRYSNAIRGMQRWREHWHEHAWPFLLEIMDDTQCIPPTTEPPQRPVVDKIKMG